MSHELHSGTMEAYPGDIVAHLTNSGAMEANPGGMVAHHIATVSCCCHHCSIRTVTRSRTQILIYKIKACEILTEECEK
jgi:hypothetical protein